MIPNLLEATQAYWRKLNELETAYLKGEISLGEVDTKVAMLIAELEQERRVSVQFLVNSLRDNSHRIWESQREVILGLGVISVLAYSWIVVQ